MMHDMMGGGMMWGMGRPGLLIIIVLVLAAETRRQTGSAPRAGISSTNPSVRSLPNTCGRRRPSVGRKFNATILALRGRGQEHKLGVG